MVRLREFTSWPEVARTRNHATSHLAILVMSERLLIIVKFLMKESEIGVLERGSVYSDASELSIKNNRIELIEEGAFDASVRKFDFIGEFTRNMVHWRQHEIETRSHFRKSLFFVKCHLKRHVSDPDP